ncbi:MAG: nitroreductase family protein [Clostridia bacterium]|nr:nitroreductase family protein [Clostridia bacterium]
MEFEKIVDIRQSTRKFADKSPDRETLFKILDAGRRAPTAKNVQPVKVYIAESEKACSIIDKASPCRYGAPTVLIVCVDTNEAFILNKHSTAEIDGSIAATHLMLAATNYGVDSIWIEMFNRDVIKKELKIPDNMLPVCLLPVGYRAEDCPVSRNFHNRKPIENFVTYLKI